MPFELAPLPYADDALAPHISAETISYHYGKHHAAYVDNLNGMLAGTIFEESSLEEIILKAEGSLFNQAAQVWNHSFYWQSLTPEKSTPSAALAAAIDSTFGSYAAFVQQFNHTAMRCFGSGWCWLIVDNENRLAIINSSNADTPIRDGLTPLLVCDLWEHAYYIDYRNRRADYLDGFWQLVNWNSASTAFAASTAA